jgi:hypothetical protein
MRWILLGGAVVILLPSVAIFFWAWTMGEVLNIASLPMDRPAPMSLSAAREAALYAYLFALFVGLPLFALWSIVCVTLALVKRVRSGR